MECVRLTGLWRNIGKDGKPYLSGNLTGITRLMVFPNQNKRGEKDPDYLAWVMPVEKKFAEPKEKSEDSFDF